MPTTVVITPASGIAQKTGTPQLLLSQAEAKAPKPKKAARALAGLHREVWQGAGTYLKDEREDW